ncbi:MAG: D-Ala-D-Ala carboxypeptidase family metallohydrolase [Rhizobiaceae bacterium]|nr:D-Ala-D-Ala carboxypeptidase family metallohydrolase [Rhizobiaceae bacterium]
MATAAMLSGCMSSSDAILGFAPPDNSASSGFSQANNSAGQRAFAGSQKQTLAYAGDSTALSQPRLDGSFDDANQADASQTKVPSTTPTQPEADRLAVAQSSKEAVAVDQKAGAPDQPAATPSVSNAYAQPKKRGSLLSRLFSIGTPSSANPVDQKNRDDSIAQSKTDSITVSAIPADVDDLPGLRLDTLFETDSRTGSEAESAKNIQLASAAGLGRLSRHGLRQQHDRVKIACLKPDLLKLLSKVRRHYKRDVIITSGFRDAKHNASVGGARSSRHTRCEAADIQVDGVTKWQLAKYLRTVKGRGGVGTYCHTKSVHIDVGKKRDWNWRCRRR